MPFVSGVVASGGDQEARSPTVTFCVLSADMSVFTLVVSLSSNIVSPDVSIASSLGSFVCFSESHVFTSLSYYMFTQ